MRHKQQKRNKSWGFQKWNMSSSFFSPWRYTWRNIQCCSSSFPKRNSKVVQFFMKSDIQGFLRNKSTDLVKSALLFGFKNHSVCFLQWMCIWLLKSICKNLSGSRGSVSIALLVFLGESILSAFYHLHIFRPPFSAKTSSINADTAGRRMEQELSEKQKSAIGKQVHRRAMTFLLFLTIE